MAVEDDPLYDAERQMVEHEVEGLKAAPRKLLERLGSCFWERMTEEEVNAALVEMVAEDPELREQLERAGTFQQFRHEAGGPQPE